jgi:hypothetical protein
MSHEDFENVVRDLEHWALGERERLVYRGTRPLSVCSTVEAAAREAAIAKGNAIAHSAELAEIESISAHANECLRALERFHRRENLCQSRSQSA